MSEEFSANGKFATAVTNYLSKNYAKEGELLIDKRYKMCYLSTSANNYPSEIYNSKDCVTDLIEDFVLINNGL